MFCKSNITAALLLLVVAAPDTIEARRSCNGSNKFHRMMNRYNHYNPLMSDNHVRNYRYHRSPQNALSLLGDISTSPFFFPSSSSSLFTNSLMRQQSRNGFRSPQYEVEETKDSFQIYMEVPGISAHDLSVELMNDGTTLRVYGTKQQSRTSSTSSYRSSSRFDQMFSLDPKTVNVSNLSVSLQDGILTIQLPKLQLEEEQKKDDVISIPVQVKEDTKKEFLPSKTATEGLEIIEDEPTKEEETVIMEKKTEDEALEISPEEDI